MRQIVILILLLSAVTTSCLFGQNQTKGCQAIYLKKEALYQLDKCDSTIKNVFYNLISNRVIVSYKNGTKTKYLASEILGYKDSGNNFFRIDSDTYDKFELKGKSPFYFYLRTTGRSTNYYFSKEVASKLYLFTKKNLYTQFDSSTVKTILANKYYRRKL